MTRSLLGSLAVLAAVAILVAAVVWALLGAMSGAMTAPSRQAPDREGVREVLGTATVEGLPGQRAPVSLPATCFTLNGVIIVETDTPTWASALGISFDVTAETGDPTMWVTGGDLAARSQPARRSAISDGGVRGEMEAELEGPSDGSTHTSLVRLTWDCGRAP